jgi:hypothetical protein
LVYRDWAREPLRETKKKKKKMEEDIERKPLTVF